MRQIEAVRLKVTSLAEAQAQYPPILQPDDGKTALPNAAIFIVDTVDTRAALSLVSASPRPDKRVVFFGTAESGASTAGRPGYLRTILRLMRDTFASPPLGALVVADPGHRGKGAEFWTKIETEAPAIIAWLAESGAQLAVVRVGSGAPPSQLSLARVEANALPLVQALCHGKNIIEIDERVQHASQDRLKRFIDVLTYDDDGDAYFEELEAATNDAEKLAREEADRFIREFFVGGRVAGAAAIFSAAQLPRVAFSDFQVIVSDILTSDAFARKKDEPPPVLDDATLDAVGLKRARVSRPNQSPVTALRFARGTRFAEIVRGRVETQAPVFSGHAFDALQARATIGALRGETAEMVAERAAVHIVANGGGDIDKLATTMANWLAFTGINVTRDNLALKQRVQSAQEQMPRLLVAAARGFAAAAAISAGEATAVIALNMLRALPDGPIKGGALARTRAQCAYIGLVSGASEARIVALIQATEALDPAGRWLVQALIGDNFGLVGSDLPRPALEGVDRLIGACIAELGDGQQVGPRRRLLEAICLRSLCLRVHEDSDRVVGEAPPDIATALVAQLLRLSARKDGIGGGFLFAERKAAEALRDLDDTDRAAFLGKSAGGILLAGTSDDQRPLLAAAEAAFRINTSLASALFGSDASSHAASQAQAFDAFAFEIQKRSSSDTPVKVNYAIAGLWQEDFTQNPIPFAKALSAFTRHTAELRAIAPAIAVAMATARRTEQGGEGHPFAHVRCTPDHFSLMPPPDRTERQSLIQAAQGATDLVQKAQEAWRDGLERVENRAEQSRLMREVRARNILMRTYASAVRNIGIPAA